MHALNVTYQHFSDQIYFCAFILILNESVKMDLCESGPIVFMRRELLVAGSGSVLLN